MRPGEPGRPAPARAPDDGARLAEFMDVAVALACGDTSARVTIQGDGSLLDGIATGVNMLADELAERAARDQGYQRRLLHVERLAAVGQLAAGLAHEINNPAAFLAANLTTLRGHARVLAEFVARTAAAGGDRHLEQVVEEVRDIAEDNLEGVRRISAVARSLLEFARVEAGRVEPTRLDEVAEEACALAAHEVGSRARLVKQLEPVPPLAADRAKLVQLATNLLVNAAHSLPEGEAEGHEISVSTGVEDGRAVLRVCDHGEPIPAGLEDRVFEPFFTLHPRGRTTGLGLYLAHEIVRGHGGELRCTSCPMAGTAFEAWLPLQTGLALTAPPAPAAAAPKARPRVLLVDDEPSLLAAYQRLLAEGFEVVVAGGGRQALELLDRDSAFDAVVCDIMLPDVDGPAVWQHLERHHPELARRTAFCTAGAFTARSMAFAESMRDRLLGKPVDPEALGQLVARLGRAGGGA